MPRKRQSLEDLDQRAHAGRLDADRLDHRHAQFSGQPLGIDHNALAARDIAHVERDHHGKPQSLQTQHQTQVLAQIGCVGHANDEVGLSLSAAPAEQYIGGDLLVRSQRIEAVGSRQVQYANPQAGRGEQRPFFALDGYAGVVGDLLPAARENIEQGGFTAVGISNQRDERTGSAGQSLHGLTGLRLLRAHADTGGLEQPQRERTRTNAYGNGRPRHQPAGDDSHGFAGQKAQFGQAPPQFDRRRRIGRRDGYDSRASAYTQFRQLN